MQWINITQERPVNGSLIVVVHPPEPNNRYENDMRNRYPMGMQVYKEYIPWHDYVDWVIKHGGDIPNYWWVYADDFPFPDKVK